ncbi:MAG TPA: DUF1003 domain-containing protein [Polyangiaceae bacterium]|nr:DUF1003 domain-containing protein [Polyangiaceae bacterium]
MTTPADLLAEVPLFELLDEGARAALAERLERINAPAGKTLFSRGDPGNALYVVMSGEVEMFFKNDTGERIVLERAGPGDFFGEVSLLDGGPRTATAVATSDLEALVVDRADLAEFIGLRPESAMALLAAMGQRLRESARLLRHSVSRDINEETEDKRTTVMKVADWISDFSGSLPFLFIHIGIFFVWIVLNVGPLARSSIGGFDPFPFGLLTMVVSLEAIILSVFVLLSQNRQVARDRVRNDIEYQVNMKAELEIAHLHEKFDHLHEMVARLAAPAHETPRRKIQTSETN